MLRRRIRTAYRLARALATDQRLPRPVRALIWIGLLPLPGPLDEFALALAGVLLICYRRRVRQIVADSIHLP